jgi:hypothetical protein
MCPNWYPGSSFARFILLVFSSHRTSLPVLVEVVSLNKNPKDKQRYKVLQVVIEREGKKPLAARWGGISLHWDIKAPIKDHWMFLGPGRSELEKRLLADTCEYCGTTADAEQIEVHHIRALKDLKAPDGREKPAWVKIMAARKRKTLVLCATCHQDVTYGRPMRRKPKSVHVQYDAGKPIALKGA